jgi:tellurite resistance protein TerC
MIFASQEGVQPEKNPVIRLARRFFPVTDQFEGQSFLALHAGKLALTPLALVLLMVETTDLIFAVDSIPAIFGVTHNPFIVFTSNVFAILGLRSLYFVLANLIGYFRYLKLGLSFVLVFIGLKMLLDPHGAAALDDPAAREPFWFQMEISTGVSLMVVGFILFCSIMMSLVASFRDQRRLKVSGKPPDDSR